jgi:hypothetical protein
LLGSLVVTGNYSQSSSGVLNLEAESATSYDQLEITGSATLAGTLTLSTLWSYAPGEGDELTLLSFASCSGSFGTVNLPELDPEYFWDVLDDGSNGTITFAVAPVEP